MTQTRIAILLLLMVVPASLAFDLTVAREVVNTIAADDFEGRRSGHPGGVKTEEYLANALQTYAIEPGGHGYFQEVPLLVTVEQHAELTLMDHELGKIPFQLGLDYAVMTHSGTAAFIAPVVIVGHGYVRPDKGRDDYGDVDVRNKAVVIVRGTPDSPFDFSEDNNRKYTLKWARERGASAVLFYQDQGERIINGAAIPAESYEADVPLLYVSQRVVGLLLDGLGYSVETYQKEIKQGPHPLDTGKRLWINTQTRKLPRQSARNVLGIIYGTDPALKNEIIVIGAHMDHLGKNANGIVYNGADDNAAGTAIALEVARSIAVNPLRRSVLVAFFCAEEDGLLGSEYFVRHPTIPLGNIVCMINLDSDGNGDGTVVMGAGELLGSPWRDYVARLDSAELAHLRFYRESGGGHSDYASFQEIGVPAIPFWSSGDHPFYHTSEDDAQWVSDKVLDAIGSRAEDFVRYLGNLDRSQASHADSLRVMARMCRHVDLQGFTVDAFGSIPELPTVSAAWLPDDPYVTPADMVKRISELRYAGEQRKILSGSLKEAIKAHQDQKASFFIGVPATALRSVKPPDVATLVRQGVSLIKLPPASRSKEPSGSTEALEAARKAGALALVPFDFSVASQVERWKQQAIVHGTLKDLAAAPQSVRDGLLNSDALIILDVTEVPAKEQVDAIYPARSRRVHLNIRTPGQEPFAKNIVASLFEAGLTRHDVLLLTGGNLRRFQER